VIGRRTWRFSCRHELSILRRQAGQPRFEPHDRLLLAALSRVLPRRGWNAFLVRPETLLRWHRRLVARRWSSPHRRPGRRPIDAAVRALIVRLARENPSWGYQRIVGELRKLGLTVSATSIRTILANDGLPPAPPRDRRSWRTFLRAHGESILACDFSTVDTVWLRRVSVLVFLCVGSRRIDCVACTSKPETASMLQQARNRLMALDDHEQQLRFLVHDRGSKFPRLRRTLGGEKIKVTRTPVQAPNANAHMERWVGNVRRECLDRLMIVGSRQLEHVLRVSIRDCNRRRPHRALGLRPPDPSTRSPVSAASAPGVHDDLVLVDSTPVECARSIETTRPSQLADAVNQTLRPSRPPSHPSARP
jgi:putative transposase